MTLLAYLDLLVTTVIVLWAAWLRRDHPGFITVPILLIDCMSVAVAFIPSLLYSTIIIVRNSDFFVLVQRVYLFVSHSR